MSRSRGGILLAATAAVLLAAAAGLALDGRVADPTDAAPIAAVAGGLGLGATAGVGWSVFAFDPRIESSCENELWPIPGLPCPNPVHGTGVVDYPPRDAWLVSSDAATERRSDEGAP